MEHFPSRHTRRDAVRLLGLAALMLPAALRPRAVDAILGWCRNDPTITIDGQTADIFLSSYEEMNQLATGPAHVVVTVPTGVPTALISADAGFGGHGYHVRFVHSKKLTSSDQILEVQINVHAPARQGLDGPLPVRVEFIPRGAGRLVPGSAEGWASEWVTLLANTPAPPTLPLPPESTDTTTPIAGNQQDKKKGNKTRARRARARRKRVDLRHVRGERKS